MLRLLLPTGFIASVGLLLARLPFSSVDAVGVAWTILFYALNPPFILVRLLAPYREDDPNMVWWRHWQYPAAGLTALVWWVFLLWLVTRRRREAS